MGGRPAGIPNERRAVVVVGDLGWSAHAACKGVNPDVMFPVMSNGTGGRPRRDGGRASRSTGNVDPGAAHAKSYCARCPVRSECLEYALAFPSARDQHGIFGGLTPSERRRARLARGSR